MHSNIEAIRARIEDATTYIRRQTDFAPRIGLVLGSGLGDFCDAMEIVCTLNYADIPGFPRASVPGHAGTLVFGHFQGQPLAVMRGRVHCYEGYTQQEVTIPVRVLRRLGVETLLLTNAAGGINLDFSTGALMVITDHINFSGQNPLVGQNLDDFGPRFPDMSTVYSPALRNALLCAAQNAKIPLRQGVYLMCSGPSFETPAEIRAFRTLGADAVGMSTVPEAIVARHAGMQVLGISCITNMAAGVLNQPLSHQEVMDTTNQVKADFIRVVGLAVQAAAEHSK